jgi:hypothetical protein
MTNTQQSSNYAGAPVASSITCQAMSIIETNSISEKKPMGSTSALVMMAKAPVLGFAKTRLIPALGEQGAALLAERLLMHTVETCFQTQAFTYIELCVTPNCQHISFESIREKYGLRISCSPQSEGNLGQRMSHTFERLLQNYAKVILIGTDAPALTAQALDQAAQALQQHDAVFVPANDGGYALIGLKRLLPKLFIDMAWSTDTVMHTSRTRLKQAGWSVHEFAPVFDIDEPADLKHLPVGWSK